MGALVGQPPIFAFWVMPFRISAARLAEQNSTISARMPSTRRPEAVSSMFSVTETSCTPAWRSAVLIATWSSIERASRSILWTTTAPMPPSATRRSMALSMGRSVVRADSPASVNSPARLHPRSADIEVAPLGADQTHLSISGRYEPPMRAIGRILDRTLLHRVAEATVKDFLDRVAERIRTREPATT
jgi:hypothetical protein